MFLKRFVPIMLVLLLITGVFAGCAKPTDKPDNQEQPAGNQNNNGEDKKPEVSNEPKREKVTLTFSWWGEKERHDGTIAAIDLWNEQNPDIQVEPFFSGWDGYHDKLGTQFAGKDAPDVFQYSIANLKEYASKGLLEPLDDYKDTLFADLDASLWGDYLYESKTYGVSAGINGGALVYNKTKLDELGVRLPTDNESWESFLDLCKEVTQDTDGDGQVDFWGIQDPIDQPIDGINSYLIDSIGVKMWADDLKSSNFGKPEVVEALKKLGQFRDAKVCPEPDSVTLKDGQGYIDGGYAAFGFIALSSFSGIQGNTEDELDMVVVPSADGVQNKSARLSAGLPFGIYSESKHKEEALQFIAWLTTSGDAAKTMGMVRGIFPSKSQRDAVADDLSDNDKKVFRVADIISGFGEREKPENPLNLGEWDKIYTVERDKYSFSQVTLEEFLANVVKNADPVLLED